MKNLIRVVSNSFGNGVSNSVLLHINGVNKNSQKLVNPIRQNTLFYLQKYWKGESKTTILDTSKISRYRMSAFQGSDDSKI